MEGFPLCNTKINVFLGRSPLPVRVVLLVGYPVTSVRFVRTHQSLYFVHVDMVRGEGPPNAVH